MITNIRQTSFQSLYPHSSPEPGRMYSSDNYRFGFNGQEMDNEITGIIGSHTTAMFWEYDTRLGRRWNVDPVVKENESPYLCFSGNPIWFSDPAGDNAGHWLTKSGQDIGDDGRADDNTYVVDDNMNTEGTTAKNLRDTYEAKGGKIDGFYKLSISFTTFVYYANTVNNESSGDYFESYAIASAINNYAGMKGRQIIDMVGTSSGAENYAHGAGTFNLSTVANNAKFSNEAVINAMLGGEDYSHGATHWDGFDFAGKGLSHYKAVNGGVEMSQEHLDNYSSYWTSGNLKPYGYKQFSPTLRAGSYRATQTNTGRVLYKSSATYGGTIFWRPNYQGRVKVNFGNPKINMYVNPNNGYNWKYF